MDPVLGTSVGVFVGLTVILIGGAAFMTGQALASTWRPSWHAVPYGLMLAAGDRFLVYALFNGPILSVSGYVVAAAVLCAIALVAFRLTQARKMVTQYPWLYERSGLFTWRDKRGTV
jgi:hypothetical protein